MNPFFQNLALPFLSDLPLLTCCCHGNNFTLFSPLNLHLIFDTTVSPPRSSLACPSKDVLVPYTLCEFSYHNPRPNYFHSVGNVTAVACRPSPDQLFTSHILDGLWSCLNVLFALLLHRTAFKLSWETSEVINELLFHDSLKLTGILSGVHSYIEWGTQFKVWYSSSKGKTKDMVAWGTE